MIQAHLLVSGHVQGVFYRASAQEKAVQLGLTGWAKNCSDGRVEMLIQGDPKPVQELIRWAKTGPTSASVESVQVDHPPISETFTTFEIRY